MHVASDWYLFVYVGMQPVA